MLLPLLLCLLKIVINHGLHNGFIIVIVSIMVATNPSPSYNIFIVFTSINWEKMIKKVDVGVAFINQNKNIM
jgi:hypothetical protein